MSTQSNDPKKLAVTPVSDQDVSDAYIYLLARLLVTRQQQLDFKEGFQWNELVHRKPGQVDWPNPNLDVAYSEAWVAVDEHSCLLVQVPKIAGRYYTVQFLNGWGETVANINERVIADHPSGQFAVCLKGSTVAVPPDARRIDLPVKYVRVLARVELGSDWDEAIALQHQFSFKASGTPTLPEIPVTPLFESDALPGVVAFEVAERALDSEVDINPGMEAIQATTRAIAKAVKDPAERARIDAAIRGKAFADFHKALPIIGHGTLGNHWALPSTSGVYGDDWLTRTLVNYGGIWANEGGTSYRLTVPPNAPVEQYWSVTAYDRETHALIKNVNRASRASNSAEVNKNADGSVDLYFGPTAPAGKESNWVPTDPARKFELMLRLYAPTKALFDKTWKLRDVEKM